MRTPLYAPARDIKSLNECKFYHTMDLPNLGTVEGEWDLRGRVDDYVGGVDVKGKRLLDTGSASGFLSFELEQRGAKVVSFDSDSAERTTLVPIQSADFNTDRAAWLRIATAGLEAMKNSYWLAHRLYRSRAQAFYGDIYDLPAELGNFDVVVVGMILVHLADPVNALASVAKRCSDTLVVTEGMIDSDNPIMGLCSNSQNQLAFSWWHLSTGLYRELMAMFGFEIVNITTNSYRCNAEESLGLIPVKTLVARRK